jgi:hypothetical protein
VIERGCDSNSATASAPRRSAGSPSVTGAHQPRRHSDTRWRQFLRTRWGSNSQGEPHPGRPRCPVWMRCSAATPPGAVVPSCPSSHGGGGTHASAPNTTDP